MALWVTKYHVLKVKNKSKIDIAVNGACHEGEILCMDTCHFSFDDEYWWWIYYF